MMQHAIGSCKRDAVRQLTGTQLLSTGNLQLAKMYQGRTALHLGCSDGLTKFQQRPLRAIVSGSAAGLA